MMKIYLKDVEAVSAAAMFFAEITGEPLAGDEDEKGWYVFLSDKNPISGDTMKAFKEAVARVEAGERPRSALKVLAERKAKLTEAFTAGDFSAAADILLGA